MREPHVCHVPLCWPPTGRANQATSLHLNNPDSQRKWKTRLRPPASAVSVCGVVGRGCSSTRFTAPWAHTRCTRNAHTQTRPDVGLGEQGPACGSGRCCGATRVCPRARVRVHREAQARSSVETSSASEGAAGSPLPGPVQAGALSWWPLWGRRVWGRGAHPAQAVATPGDPPRVRPWDAPPSVWSPAVHVPSAGLRTRSGAVAAWSLLPWRRGPRGQQQQGPGARRGAASLLSGAERGRGAAGPLCTGRRAPGPAISRASPPSTRRCSSRCSPRPGEASVGERPGS